MKAKSAFGESLTNVFVLGHRGMRACYPENTMLSFKKANELGVDMIETDVHLSEDGVPVLIHDSRLERTTDGKGFVSNTSLKDLKKLDAGVRFNGVYQDCRIPTLEEFLAWVAGETQLTLNIEIKDMRAECVDKTVDMIKSFGLFERIVLASFDAAVIRYAHSKHGILTQGFPESYMQNFDGNTYAAMFGAGVEMKDLTPDFCENMRALGVEPWGFCADTDEQVYQAIRAKVTMITCNNPEPALRILKECGLRKK